MGRTLEYRRARFKWGILKAVALVASLFGFYKVVTDYLDAPDLVLGATAVIVGVFILLYPFQIVNSETEPSSRGKFENSRRTPLP